MLSLRDPFTPKKKIVVIGAGIAGLTAAHYLAKSGQYSVTVIEKLNVPGGLARSERPFQGPPIEYSWRGFGPWYNNAYEVLKEIPTDASSVFDHLQPINFNRIDQQGCTAIDKAKLGWLALKTWSSTPKRYQNTPAIEALDVLTPGCKQDVGYLLGPWVGSDIGHVSQHHSAQFFQRNIFPGTTREWPSGFKQGSRDAWVVTKLPTNEAWFNPWVKLLRSKGVTFRFGVKVDHFLDENTLVSNEGPRGIEKIKADRFVLATDPFTAVKLLPSSNLIDPRVLSEPHRQVSFRVVFDEPIKTPPNAAYVLLRTPYDLTFYQPEWGYPKSLWSGTATLDSLPGFNGLRMRDCSVEKLITELKTQLLASSELQKVIRENNSGKELKDFSFHILLWPSWQSPNSTNPTLHDPQQQKWVNDSQNRTYQKKSKLGNIILAGAYMKTEADLYSMEAAVESGKRAADLILGTNTVIPQSTPIVLKVLKKTDSLLYRLGLPNVLICLAVGMIMGYFLYKWYKSRGKKK